MKRPIHIPRPITTLLLPVLIPLALLGCAVSIPWSKVHQAKLRRRRRSLLAKMQSAGRTITWDQFVYALEHQQGTAIEERASFKGPENLWWTPEDVDRVSPYHRGDWFSMLKEERYKPFLSWCHDRYTNPETGSAVLVVWEGSDRSHRHAVLKKWSESLGWIVTAPAKSISNHSKIQTEI